MTAALQPDWQLSCEFTSTVHDEEELVTVTAPRPAAVNAIVNWFSASLQAIAMSLAVAFCPKVNVGSVAVEPKSFAMSAQACPTALVTLDSIACSPETEFSKAETEACRPV